MKEVKGKVGAVIVAAGGSRRMAGVDKVFAEVEGRPLLAFVVDIFQSCSVIDEVVVVLSRGNLERGRRLAKEQVWPKLVEVCLGGARRQDSVSKGLLRLVGCDWVVIHDGARPCISVDLIERGLVAAQENGAAIAGVPVNDTIKIVSRRGYVQETPKRECLWAIQTPQIFRFDLIKEAYGQMSAEVTDDAMLLERLGHKVEVYMGSYDNIKLTTPEDLIVVETFLKNRAGGDVSSWR
ncbi:2-C-methyl-D-erythritol 4-phosphate cytidylyltransferase [Chloroflexota bacterium]